MSEQSEQPKTWNEAHLPPPWRAEEIEPGLWRVVSDGYEDETPAVCGPDPVWGLDEHHAHILAASLDMRDALRVMVDTYRDDGCDDADQPKMIRAAVAALAKSRGEA